MIQTESGKPKVESRRLWPIWVGSAAACIALLFIALPTLFRSENPTPMVVAKATELPTSKETDTIIESSLNIITSTTKKGRKTIEAPTLIASSEPEELPQEEPLEESILAQESTPSPLPISEETTEEGPRIHRRTSTQMVCSNCNIDNVQSPRTTIQELLAASFGTATNTPLTLKSFEF